MTEDRFETAGKEHASAFAKKLRRTQKAVNSNGSFKGKLRSQK
jgi:hypothetical protein